MRPESVEIKVSVAGEQVPVGIGALALGSGKAWSVVFCEDVTDGLTPVPTLLGTGVVLRARAKAGPKGDSTVKLRPCRWSQLAEDFFTNESTNQDLDGGELKIEADWSGSSRVLAASLTASWSDDRLAAVRAGALPVTGLLTDRQRRFLERCGPGRVNLSAVSALADVAATRWDAFSVDAGGVHLSVRAERWTLAGPDGADGAGGAGGPDVGLDFLELSIVSSVDGAAKDQAALERFVADRGLDVDPAATSKTQRVLARLVARALA